MKAIFSMSRDYAIGNTSNPFGLVVHSKADLLHFKHTTQGGVAVMGSATFESMGRNPLPNRRNCVLSKSAIYDEAETFRSIQDLVCGVEGESSVWVIGGAQVIESLVPYIDEYVITVWDFVASSLSPTYNLTFLGPNTRRVLRELPSTTINTVYDNSAGIALGLSGTLVGEIQLYSANNK